MIDREAPYVHENSLYSPYLPHPTIAAAEDAGRILCVSWEQALRHLLKTRNDIVRKETVDPLRHMYEPDIWKLCWGLLDVPWQKKELNEEIRRRLGFEKRVRVLLVMGDNRGSKTTFEMLTLARLQWYVPKTETWSFQTTHDVAVNTHHKMLHQFLPPELRNAGKIMEEVTNISWGQKDGFTKSKYVLPNGSEHTFKNYSQGPPSPLESGNPNAIAADEEMVSDWAERAEIRVASSNGFFILSFTPINGYSQTVYTYYHGAKTILDAPAFLLPADGGPPLPWLQIGLTEAEYGSVVDALDRKEAPIYPLSRPPTLEEILTGGRPDPAGRHFERMPRVLRAGAHGDKAIVHFHSGDNPFGTPSNVVKQALEMPMDRRKITVYGFATKTVSSAFVLFDENVHGVAPEAIPEGGTNWLIVDPSNARPFFMLWRRDLPDGRIFIYREWPSAYAIPGLGFLGDWAEQGGVSAKKFDGKRGPAQRPIGWGAARYKEEVARLEDWELAQQERPAEMTYEAWIKSWSEWGPARERMHKRFMDARFSAVNNIQDGGVKSLFETFDEVGLTFEPTNAVIDGADSRDDGLQMITTALSFDPLRTVDYFNQPRLFISRACVNLIFAMKIYTGLDKTDSACGDPIDCLRYSFKMDCKYIERREAGGRPGRGCY